MKLTFWGAARNVTGSMHLLELQNGKKLLLDCGLFQGRRAEADTINGTFPAEASAIDAVLLSHAHIDHSGMLPGLYRAGFRGRIFATHATYDLCALMLMDSAYIQQSDAGFYNKKFRKKGEPPVEPLYTKDDAERTLELFVGIGYRAPFSPVDGCEVEFRDAGHILGSATMTITVTEDGRQKRLGFTGDLGNPGRPILRDPQPMLPCDWLISESTYGGMEHGPVGKAKDALADVVGRTAERGGKVIIPAFAVGRTQELVYALDQLWNEERIPRIPVFVDSPLAVNVTGVYQSHPECYNDSLQDYLMSDDDPFGFEQLEYVRDVKRSKALNGMHTPMVIISASGMAEHGRVLHHLRNNIEDPKNTVMIVGFMAEHTLGKRIVERRDVVNIFGQPHRLRAEVAVQNYFSAHADEPGLLEFIGTQDHKRLQQIFLVHGDLERQQKLSHALTAEGYGSVAIPERGDVVEL